MTDWQRALPRRYAASHVERLVARYDDPYGLAVRRMVAAAWPGVPASVVLGQSASVSRASANTTDTSKSQRFHEGGYGQNPMGLRNGPAPNPDPKAPYNRWGALHDSALVVSSLGRPATMVPDAWKTALDDQAAVTLASLRHDLARISRHLRKHDPRLVPADEGSLYAVFLSYSAFSRGASGAWRRLKPALVACADVPEVERPVALTRWVATTDDPAASVPGSAGVARLVLRDWWKIESGRALETAIGGASLAWYGPPLDGDIEERLTRRALGV